MPFGEGRAQLVARIGGTTDKLPLGFTGHLDTVPLGAQPWSVDPLAADITDGKLYGRGSSDMKSGVAAFVTACVALADRLAGTAGSCCLSPPARKRVAPAPRPWLGPRPLFLRSVRLLCAEPTGNRALVGHKGALWFEAVTTGVTAHGSMPEKGVNAVHKAARAVTAFAGFRFQFRAARCSWRPNPQRRYDPWRVEYQFSAGPRRDRPRHPHNPRAEPRENLWPVGKLSRSGSQIEHASRCGKRLDQTG